MKKTINTVRIATIALWPIIFLLVIGAIEQRVHLSAAMNFRLSNHLLLIPVYIFSGCLFAFNIFCEKEFIRQKNVVYAYVFSAVSVILFCLFWMLSFFGMEVANHAVRVNVLRVPIGVFASILGLTIFVAIKAIWFYKKAAV